MITIALKLKSVNIIFICFQEIKHTWALGIGQIYEHKTIHLELADSYIQISFKEAIHMGFKSLSAIILQKSKLQYSIEVIDDISELDCGQLDSAIFQLSW